MKTRDGVLLVRHSLASTFVYRGRARRLEVVWFWLAGMIFGIVLDLATAPFLELPRDVVARELIGWPTALPLFALFVRRLHDQGRSGWWALMLPMLMANNLYTTVRVNLHAFDPAWPDPGYWTLPLLPAAILVIVFIVVPGEQGPNRYGPDPRDGRGRLARA